jgi:hypothetical protein
MNALAITARIYAISPNRPTPQARRGAVKVWSSHVEQSLASTLSAALGPKAPPPGLAELRIRLGADGALAELVRPTGSAATDSACLAAAKNPQSWPPPPSLLADAEFVVQIEFPPRGAA